MSMKFKPKLQNYLTSLSYEGIEVSKELEFQAAIENAMLVFGVWFEGTPVEIVDELLAHALMLASNPETCGTVNQGRKDAIQAAVDHANIRRPARFWKKDADISEVWNNGYESALKEVERFGKVL